MEHGGKAFLFDTQQKKVLWLQSLFTELGVEFTTPTILCANLSTVSPARNPFLHVRTKHVGLVLLFVRKVNNQSFHLYYVSALHKCTHILIEPKLSHLHFRELQQKLSFFCFYQFSDQPLLSLRGSIGVMSHYYCYSVSILQL